jgi:hypothetical protein
MRLGSIDTSTHEAAPVARAFSSRHGLGLLLAMGALSLGCLEREPASGSGMAEVAQRAENVAFAAPRSLGSSSSNDAVRPPVGARRTSARDASGAGDAPETPRVPSTPTQSPVPAGTADDVERRSADAEHDERSPVAPPRLDAVPSASTLGYNMDYPGDWTNMPPFIDQMKNARAVEGECSAADPACDPTRHLDLDENGWVASLRYADDPSRAYSAAHFIVSTSRNRPDIGETFVVTWDGNARVQIHGGGDVRSEPGQRRLTFVLRAGDTMLSLRDIDPADHARNIRIFRADHEARLVSGEIFSPDMLSFLEPFGSLRFMDWMDSNGRGQCSGGSEPGRSCYAVTQDDCGGGGTCIMAGHWDTRPDTNTVSYVASGQYLDTERPELGTRVGGYPVEVMVALANRAGKNPHFNMPADFDEDYVRSFAAFVRDHLAPGLRASVEYSNEVWNWGFPQAGYANARGRALWPNEGSAWVQFAAGRTSEMCRLWKEVFAGEESRVRCLISPQTDWKEMAANVLECPAWVASHPGSPACHAYADAISITGYFSGCLHQNEATVMSWLDRGKPAALDLAFEQLTRGGLIEGCSDSLDTAIERYRFFAGLAETRGLELYVYESGTHFAYDADDSARQFLVDMTRDERMYDVYRDNFAGFRLEGGGMFNVWGWVAPEDAWANADSILERNHPKYRAIADFARDGAP